MSNVTPFDKNKLAKAVAQSIMPGMEHRPYVGPSQTIKEVLDHHKFDEMAVDKDWIELRIIAKFSATGAIVHTMQARQIVIVQREAPGKEILQMVAKVNEMDDLDTLFNIATIEEVEKLNEMLAGLDQDHMLVLAMQDDGYETILEGREGVDSILEAVVARYEDAQP